MRARVEGETLILAEPLVERVLGEGAEVARPLPRHRPRRPPLPRPGLRARGRRPGDAFQVLAGDFVTTEDGTGLVHIAPAFGEDDYAVAAAAGLFDPTDHGSLYNPVGLDGKFDLAGHRLRGQVRQGPGGHRRPDRRPRVAAACSSASRSTSTPTRTAGAAARRSSTTRSRAGTSPPRRPATSCSPTTRRSAGTPSTSSTAASANGWRTTSTGRSRATATGGRRCRSGSAPARTATVASAPARSPSCASARGRRSPTTSTAPTSTTSPSTASSAAASCAASSR